MKPNMQCASLPALCATHPHALKDKKCLTDAPCAPRGRIPSVLPNLNDVGVWLRRLSSSGGLEC